jgi:hypothetical protein
MAEAGRRRAGETRSPETRAKISAALKGRPGRPLSPENKAKLIEANRRRAGRTHRPHTPETRAKISAAQKGRKLSPETRAKLSATMTGRRSVRRDERPLVDPILDAHRATRPGSATSPRRASHTLRLGEPGRATLIDGQRMEPVTGSQYAILSALLDAGDEGLTPEQIVRITGQGGWRQTLWRLKLAHPLWDAIIVFPGRRGRPYRLDARPAA